MTRKALHRAVGAGALLAITVLIASTGVVGSTVAVFNGEASNTNSAFAGGWIGAPTGITGTPAGNTMGLTWTPGNHGPITGQNILGLDNGTSATCPATGYTLITSVGAAVTTATDASRGTTANAGNWFCYQVMSTTVGGWTAQLTKNVQLGLVATAITTTNSATRCSGAPNTAAGKVDCNDTIVITFNQKPVLPASPIRVCTWSSTGTVVIGDTNATACNASNDAYSVGKISGVTIGSSIKFSTSTFALTTAAPWTMTITLKGATTASTISGTSTFTPAAGILSTLTPQATICSAAKTTCQPTTTTTF